MKPMRTLILVIGLIIASALTVTTWQTVEDHGWVCPVALTMDGGCLMSKDTVDGVAWHINFLVNLFIGIIVLLIGLTFYGLISVLSFIQPTLDPPKLVSQYLYFIKKRLKIIRHLFSALDRWLATGIYNHRDFFKVA